MQAHYADALNWTQNGDKTRTPANDSVGWGSNLVRGVETLGTHSSLGAGEIPVLALISDAQRCHAPSGNPRARHHQRTAGLSQRAPNHCWPEAR